MSVISDVTTEPVPALASNNQDGDEDEDASLNLCVGEKLVFASSGDTRRNNGAIPTTIVTKHKHIRQDSTATLYPAAKEIEMEMAYREHVKQSGPPALPSRKASLTHVADACSTSTSSGAGAPIRPSRKVSMEDLGNNFHNLKRNSTSTATTASTSTTTGASAAAATNIPSSSARQFFQTMKSSPRAQGQGSPSTSTGRTARPTNHRKCASSAGRLSNATLSALNFELATPTYAEAPPMLPSRKESMEHVTSFLSKHQRPHIQMKNHGNFSFMASSNKTKRHSVELPLALENPGTVTGNGYDHDSSMPPMRPTRKASMEHMHSQHTATTAENSTSTMGSSSYDFHSNNRVRMQHQHSTAQYS